MGARQPVLAAADMQQPLAQIDLLAPQADQFRDAQPMPVGDQDHRGVPVAMASEPLGRGDQPVDLGRGQVLPAAALGIGLFGRRSHGERTFPKTIGGAVGRRRLPDQAPPGFGTGYFPEKIRYRESFSPYSPDGDDRVPDRPMRADRGKRLTVLSEAEKLALVGHCRKRSGRLRWRTAGLPGTGLGLAVPATGGSGSSRVENSPILARNPVIRGFETRFSAAKSGDPGLKTGQWPPFSGRVRCSGNPTPFSNYPSSLSDLTPWGEPDKLRARFDRSSRIFPR